ncbi:2-oxoglutarate-dependent dioxygenase (Ascochitine biosynthesis cluster protein 3), partial [Durusdinium trenchii]
SGLWGQALEAARQLFALPEDVKLQVAAGPPSVDAPVVRGYFGVGAESGTRSSRFECKEGVSLAAGERSERLARNRLPKEFPVDQVAALEAMPAQLRLLALRLSDGLAEVAQSRKILTPEDAAFFAGGGDGLEAFRVFHYLPTTDRCAGRAPVSAELLWSSDHTDWGSLTIIAQDSNDGGLEIFQNGEYHPVASKDGALIVNGGDYLELVSHGTLLSPLHRVRERTPSSRRSSLVYFHYPAASSPLRPIDVKKAHERTRPSRPGLVFNTLTDGLEDLEEAITYKSHLQRKWMGVRAKTEL